MADSAAPTKLEPPVDPETRVEDSGAHDLSSDDDHFSDAQSGISDSMSPRGVPLAVASLSISTATAGTDSLDAEKQQQTPGGLPIPMTVVEKIDPDVPSHGEVPGTIAHDQRLADAVPDSVVAIDTTSATQPEASVSPASNTPGGMPIPVTKVERVDKEPLHGEVPGTDSFEKRKQDAAPDVMTIRHDQGMYETRLACFLVSYVLLSSQHGLTMPIVRVTNISSS